MPATPYAKLLVSVNGGGPTSGGIEPVPSGATIQLLAESVVGWTQAVWEIVDYPEGWTAPAGWSTRANGTIYYSGVTPPPSFTLPDITQSANIDLWGKWCFRLRVNEQVSNDTKAIGNLLDESTQLSMPSFNGQIDIGAREGEQFCTTTTKHKRWIRAHQRNLRKVERLIGIGNTLTTTLDQSSRELITESAIPAQVGDTFPIANDAITVVDVEAVAIEQEADRSKIFVLRRYFHNKANVITAPAAFNPMGPDVPMGAFPVSADIANTGAAGRFVVTGIADTNIRWRLDVQIRKVGAPAAAPAPTFDPLTLPETSATPKVWIDAHPDYQTEGGGLVSAVVNRAGGGAVLTIDAGDEPGFTASNPNYNNGPTLDVGAGKGIKLTSHGLTNAPFSVVFVANGGDAVWFQDANGNWLINAGGGSGDKLQLSGDGVGTLLVGDLAKKDVPGVYIFVFNGATSKIYQSKLTPFSGAGGTVGVPGATIGLASNYNTTASLVGSFRHLMVFSGALSPADCTYLLNGFGAESGLAIGA